MLRKERVRHRSGRQMVWVAVGSALLVACGSPDPASVLADADKLMQVGKLADANVKLKKFVQDDPANEGARARLARIAVANGDFTAADAELERIDAASLTDPDAQQVRLEVDLGLGRYAEVLAALAKPSVTLPAERKAQLSGQAQLGLGNLAAAEAAFQQAQQARPDWVDPALGLADVAVARQDVNAAITVIDSILARVPNDPDALVARAKLYGRKGDFVNAAAGFAKAGVEAPASWSPAKRWSAKYQEAEAHIRRNNLAAAKVVHAELVKAVPGIAATRMLAARIALIERRYQDGIEELQRLAQATSGNDGIDLLLAQAQFAGGSREQGIVTLERVVARNPTNVEAAKLLARVRLEQNRPDRALELLGALQTAGTNDPDVISLLSAAKLQQGQPEQAIATLEQAIAANPQNQSAKLQLAAARLAQRDSKGALQLLDQLPSDVLVTQQARLRLLALVADGNRERVAAVVEELLARTPPDVDGLAAALDVMRVAGRQDLARRIADKLLAAGGDNARVLLRVAQVAAGDQDWARADELLNKAVTLDPKNMEVRVVLAQVAAARGDDARALAVLDEARRVDPAAVSPSLLRAGAHLRERDATAANKVLDALLAAAPKDGVAAAAAGSLLMTSGQPELALQRFASAVEQRPTAENLYLLAQTQMATGALVQARESLVRAVTARPEWPTAVAALASLDARNGRLDDAVKRASDFARRFPNNADALAIHGEMLLAARRPDEANAVFEKAFALAPSSSLAVAKHRARQAGGAPRPEAPLAEWLANQPDDLAVRALLAEAYLRVGNQARAATEYEELLKRSDSNVLALNNLAWIYTASDLARAEALARRAHELAPRATQVLDTYGWILLKRNKANDALPLLKQAAQDSPKDASILFHYAAALAETGDTARAKEVVERALGFGIAFESRAEAEKLAQALRK
jgi:putative PEP-CTERM system TPR-repeat lipoprotein